MIPLLATFICAVLLAQTIWILRLQGQIDEMRRTWRPRHDSGPLPPMPWPVEEVEVDEYIEAVPA